MAHPLEVEVFDRGLGLCGGDHARAVLVELLERANYVLLHDASEFLLVQPVTGSVFRRTREDSAHLVVILVVLLHKVIRLIIRDVEAILDRSMSRGRAATRTATSRTLNRPSLLASIFVNMPWMISFCCRVSLAPIALASIGGRGPRVELCSGVSAHSNFPPSVRQFTSHVPAAGAPVQWTRAIASI